MTPSDRHARAKTLFADALDQPVAQRGDWLDAACDDPALRRDVLEMLDAHDEGGALDRPLLARAPFDTEYLAAEEALVLSAIGRRIGPWRLGERLGAGGMGVVYRASRADGLYEREVALKLLAPGAVLASDGRLARRLAAERQILARLEHPGIARLYDGGVTGDGLPFLALELVEGVPITDYAEREALPVAQRVALFAEACDAVAYAHRNLIVHRDLKPAHVLVEDEAGTPGKRNARVKLLDFGVSALLADPQAPTEAMLTVPLAHTPAYAAPEQLRHETITTATDVYALGMVLYELLAGQRPYEVAGLRPSEAEHRVTSFEPPPPSTVAPPEHRRALRGDLDTIVLRALAKAPERRYAAAADLAADLRRWQEGLPVEARPATTAYRVGRFIRRHRTSVAAITGGVLLLALLTGFYTARLAAERDRARAEADKATAVTLFLRSTLAAASPEEGQAIPPSQLRLIDALRYASQQAGASFPDQPEVRASVLHTLGETYLGLGLFTDAAPPLRAALALLDSLHPGPHPDRIETLDALGLLTMWDHELAGRDTFYVRSLHERARLYGTRSAEYSYGLTNLAEWLMEYGSPGEALPLVREAEALGLALESLDPEPYAYALFVLGRVQGALGRYPKADTTFTALVAMARLYLPPDDPRLGELLTELGATRLLRENYAGAEAVLREAVAYRTARYDDGHPSLAESEGLYAIALAQAGRYDEAERLLRKVLPVFETGDPYLHFEPLARAELAAIEALRGGRPDLERLTESRRQLEALLGAGHGWTRRATRHIERLSNR